MNAVEKILQEAQALPVEDQLRLIATLCHKLRTKLHPQVVSLEGRWADLAFDEEGIDQALRRLHRTSWQHLEDEGRAR